jgi:hypothetical protein
MSNNIKAVIRSSQKKSPRAGWFTAGFYPTLKEELTTMFLKLLQKKRKDRNSTKLQSQYYLDTKTR